MAIVVKRQNGTVANLDASAVALGINTSQRIGRQLEVTGFILSRTTEEAGVAATAVAFAAEGPDMGHIAINDNYDPDRPTKNWKRTMTFAGGKVGIGTGFGAGQPPAARLTVQGNIAVQNASQQTTITLDGALGDIILATGDCAEEFDVAADVQPEPGNVMVLGRGDALWPCHRAYDKRVAGVVSGAGGYKPAILLDRRDSPHRVAVAVIGKVYCKVDAQYGPIETGDLLTTSPTPGHAMRALDAARAFGAVIGKALRPLPQGTGLVPILVALR